MDWWFAYTKGISDFLVTLGVDPERITVVNNAMDTRAFEADLAAIGEEEFEIARRTLGIGEKDFVVLYCGALYEEKRISFLLEAIPGPCYAPQTPCGKPLHLCRAFGVVEPNHLSDAQGTDKVSENTGRPEAAQEMRQR